MSNKKVTEIATIDVAMVTIQEYDPEGKEPTGDILCVTTDSKIDVEVQTETEEAVKLIVKGVLKAQKKKKVTVTGNTIKLTDNVFIPEVVKVLQGGTIKYDESEPTKVIGYTPPVSGSADEGKKFLLCAYSAQYNSAGDIVQYERISYPNCTGNPVAFGAEDGTFRAPEYEIDSAPNTGQAPYDIDYVNSLPVVE